MYDNRFRDFLQSFNLYRGMGDHDEAQRVGCVKGAIRLYRGSVECENDQFLNNDPVQILVRVYVIEVSIFL